MRVSESELAAVPGTLVFFETGPRIADALADIADVLGGEREAVVARELTKAFETIRRGKARDLATLLAGEPAPKGEIVLLVGPPVERETSPEDADTILRQLLADHSVGDAASEAAKQTGLPRRDLYKRALSLKEGDGD